MEGIRSNVSVQAQQPKKSNKALKHLGNAAVTTAGIVGTGVATNRLRPHLCEGWFQASFGGPTTLLEHLEFKFYNFMKKLGNKLTSKDGLINEACKGMEKHWGGTCRWYGDLVRPKVALFATAGVVALGVLCAGIYKAGKINGEG